MIDVKNVSKYYSGFKAVDNLSFQIGDGEIVGLLGLNGAGKSTILKILGCFLMPSGGELSVDGFSVTEEPQEVRRRIGYLPDTPPLYNEMLVKDYLEFVAQLKNVKSSDLSSSVKSAMEKTNIENTAGKQLGGLSHGYRQRVGIAQALVHNPRVLILDEPINGLDPIQIVEMRDMILNLKGQHTVILSSHILSEITKTCDRMLVLDKGALVAEGSEKNLLSEISRGVSIEMEVGGCNDKDVGKITSMPGLTSHSVEVAGGIAHFSIQAERDIRAEIAKVVVENGFDLLSLNRNEFGLESLFMKLVKPGKGGGE